MMFIRRFDPIDADALASLFHETVRQVGIRDYTAEQVVAWSPSKPDTERFLRQADNGVFLVAVDADGMRAGYGILESDGHIDHLYCRPDIVGKGVGSAILLALEHYAISASMQVMYTEASEGARRLLERRGFSIIGRNDFEVNGVQIHNYNMRKMMTLI